MELWTHEVTGILLNWDVSLSLRNERLHLGLYLWGNAMTVEMLMLSLTYEKHSSNCQPSACWERWNSIQWNVSLLSSLCRSVSIRYSRGFFSQQAVSFLTVGKTQVLQIIMIALFFRVSVSCVSVTMSIAADLQGGFFNYLHYLHLLTDILQKPKCYKCIQTFIPNWLLAFLIKKKKQKNLSELIEIVLFAPWWLIQLPPQKILLSYRVISSAVTSKTLEISILFGVFQTGVWIIFISLAKRLSPAASRRPHWEVEVASAIFKLVNLG